jgi:hypothetical protein
MFDTVALAAVTPSLRRCQSCGGQEGAIEKEGEDAYAGFWTLEALSGSPSVAKAL